MALTENFQQPLTAPTVNGTNITEWLVKLLTVQPLTVYYSINGVNCAKHWKKFVYGLFKH